MHRTLTRLAIVTATAVTAPLLIAAPASAGFGDNPTVTAYKPGTMRGVGHASGEIRAADSASQRLRIECSVQAFVVRRGLPDGWVTVSRSGQKEAAGTRLAAQVPGFTPKAGVKYRNVCKGHQIYRGTAHSTSAALVLRTR